MRRQFTKGIDLYFAHVERLKTREQTVKALWKEGVDLYLIDAQELTSGTVTSAQLAAMGHPFGRNAAAPFKFGSVQYAPLGRMRGATKTQQREAGLTGMLSLLPINLQTHKLHDSLEIRPMGENRYGMYAGVEYAKYILNDAGTVRMIGRGFQAETRRRWKARNKALQDYLRTI